MRKKGQRYDYRIVLAPSNGDGSGGWVAEMPELPGCMAAADTVEEALAELELAKEAWLEVAEEDGEEPPKPIPSEYECSGKFTLRIPRSLHQRLTLLAEAEGVSLNQYVLHLISGGAAASPRREIRYIIEMRTAQPRFRDLESLWKQAAEEELLCLGGPGVWLVPYNEIQ